MVVLFLFASDMFAEPEETHPYSRIKLFCGTANQKLAQSVADALGISLNHIQISHFNDGELDIQIQESVRGFDVYILQSTCATKNSSVNDSLMELYLLARAAKRASAKSVTAIIPYYGYARQDKKMKARSPISAADVAMLIEQSGVDHVICVDLHCEQIQGFFHQIAIDNLSASTIFAPYILSKNLENIVIVSPDAGGAARVKNFRDDLTKLGVDSSMAVVVKQREKAGVIERMDLLGNVEGCTAIILDDICDTAGTLCQAASELKKHGALRVLACVTHPVFSGLALERIKNSDIEEMIVTDTIPLEDNSIAPNIKQLSIAQLIAGSIRCCVYNRSMHAL